VAIEGAVDSVYNFIAQPDDSHASFTVFVQNPCGSELSEPVLLGIISDQPFCKVYECDALKLTLQNIVSNLWVMDMPSGAAVDSVGGSNLPVFGSPAYGQPALLTDNCGELASGWEATNGFRDQTAAFITDATGSLGGYLKPTDPDSLRVIQFGILNTSVWFSLNFSGGSIMSVSITHYAGDNITLNWPNAMDSAGNFIALNFTIAAGGNYAMELFKDFVSLGAQSGTLAGSWSFGGADFRLGVTGGTGRVDGQYMYYNSSELTPTHIEELGNALAQNQTDYIDPDPNCTMPN